MDTKKICMNQAEEAKRHKWTESQKAGHDLGEDAIMDWVNKNAEAYRKEYNDTFSIMISKVQEELENHSICKSIDKDYLNSLTEIIIEKFTELWIIEVAKENHNKHIEEI